MNRNVAVHLATQTNTCLSGYPNVYRYGFQGQEKDNEMYGVEGSSINYSFRMYSSRAGRFLSTDPLEKQYAYNSPFAFSENRVIDAKELEGLEKYLVIKTYDNNGDAAQLKLITFTDGNGKPMDMRLIDNDGNDYSGSEVLVVNQNPPSEVERFETLPDLGSYRNLLGLKSVRKNTSVPSGLAKAKLESAGLRGRTMKNVARSNQWLLERPTLSSSNFNPNSAQILNDNLAESELDKVATWGNIFTNLQINIKGESNFMNDMTIGTLANPITDSDGNTYPQSTRTAGWLKDQRAGAYGVLLIPKLDDPSQLNLGRGTATSGQISVDFQKTDPD